MSRGGATLFTLLCTFLGPRCQGSDQLPVAFLNTPLSRCLLTISAIGLAPGIYMGFPGDFDIYLVYVQKLWVREWACPETMLMAFHRNREETEPPGLQQSNEHMWGPSLTSRAIGTQRSWAGSGPFWPVAHMPLARTSSQAEGRPLFPDAALCPSPPQGTEALPGCQLAPSQSINKLFSVRLLEPLFIRFSFFFCNSVVSQIKFLFGFKTFSKMTLIKA